MHNLCANCVSFVIPIRNVRLTFVTLMLLLVFLISETKVLGLRMTITRRQSCALEENTGLELNQWILCNFPTLPNVIIKL